MISVPQLCPSKTDVVLVERKILILIVNYSLELMIVCGRLLACDLEVMYMIV